MPTIYVSPLIMTLIPEFLAARRDDCERMRVGLAAGDLPAIAETAHRWAGAGGTYGLSAISDIGRALHEAARAGDASEVGRWIDEAEDLLAHTEVRSTAERDRD
jgi:HPt (histidine-containing phosphotransfer) domain-containing protein